MKFDVAVTDDRRIEVIATLTFWHGSWQAVDTTRSGEAKPGADVRPLRACRCCLGCAHAAHGTVRVVARCADILAVAARSDFATSLLELPLAAGELHGVLAAPRPASRQGSLSLPLANAADVDGAALKLFAKSFRSGLVFDASLMSMRPPFVPKPP